MGTDLAINDPSAKPARSRLVRWIFRAAVGLLWVLAGVIFLELIEAVRLAWASRIAAAVTESLADAIPGMRLDSAVIERLPPPPPPLPSSAPREPTPPSARAQAAASLAAWGDEAATAWEQFEAAMALPPRERDIRATLRGECFIHTDPDGSILDIFGDPHVKLAFATERRGAFAWKHLRGDPVTTATRYIGGWPNHRPQSHFEVTGYPAPNGGTLLWIRNTLAGLPWPEIAASAGVAQDGPILLPNFVYAADYHDGNRRVTDRFGFKNLPVEIPKPEGIYRIVCIGGSTTEEGEIGFDRVSELLQRRFDASHGPGRVEVINAGQSAADSYNLRLRVDDYLAYEPDVILYYGGFNDIVSHTGPWQRMAQWPRPVLGWLRTLSRHFNRKRLPSDEAIARFMHETNLLNIDAIRWAAEAHGARFVVCSFAYPRHECLSPREAAFLEFNTKTTWLGYGIDYHTLTGLIDLHNRLIRVWAAREGLLYIPVQESFTVGMDHFRDACHMAPPGNALRTEIVYRALAPLVPTPPNT